MNTVSRSKMIATMSVFFLSNTFISNTIYDTMNDYFLSVTVALIIVIPAVLVIFGAFSKYPYMTVSEALSQRVPKLFQVIYFLIIIAGASLSILSNFAVTLRFYTAKVVNFNPDLIFIFMLMFFVALFSRIGFDPLSNFTLFITPTVIFIFALGFFLAFDSFELVNLLPVFTTNVSSVLMSGLTIAVLFLGEFLVFQLLVGRYVDGKKTRKYILISLLIWFGITIVYGVIPIAAMGDLIQSFEYPMYQVLNVIPHTRLFFRTGFLFNLILLPIMVVRMALLLMGVRYALTEICKIVSKPVLFKPLFAVSVFVLSYLSFILTNNNQIVKESFFTVSAVLQAICLVYFVAVFYIKKPKKRKIDNLGRIH